ncbi:MAG TPA: GNAT family N-acetyltransferase [Candidatus Baltobacteraceae bacterium]|jgi:phosphoribosylglycinamide formyltransferase-1|nr:GNAT family N-acetyltransferase [Candidatus Baltobacteraceae bacterium]
MARLYNLVVDLADRPAAPVPAGIEVPSAGPADERTLAWIDECFGGAWSSEAHAGITVVARRGGAPVGFATVDPKGLTYAWLAGIARERNTGIFGPFGVAPEERKTELGRMLLSRALDLLRERGYARALIPAVGDERLVRYYEEAAGARVAEEFDRAKLTRAKRRVLVMASGDGSNFQAVVDAVQRGDLPLEIAGLLVNDERAFAIQRAKTAGIAVRSVAWNRLTETRGAYDERLLRAARADSPDFVLLLGWMHLLSDAFVATFPELVNLHPAFLPLDPQRDEVIFPDGAQTTAFRGAYAVRDALASSAPWVGATVHRVTNSTDRGPVLARKPLRVEPAEEEAALMVRVHTIEREIVRAGIMRWLYER